TQSNPAGQPSPDPCQAPQGRPAGAGGRDDPGQVAGAVADKRHPGTGQGGEDHLPLYPVRYRQACCGINDLNVEIRLADVVAAPRPAIYRPTQSHLGHAIVVEDRTPPDPLDLPDDSLRYMIGAQEDALD